jgi:hypothetical protein
MEDIGEMSNGVGDRGALLPNFTENSVAPPNRSDIFRVPVF